MPESNIPEAIEEAAKKHAGTGWKLMDGSEEYNVPQYDAFKAGYSLAIKELEGKDKEIDRLKDKIRELNAPLIYFSTMDKDPVLPMYSKENTVKHVVNVAKKYVINNPLKENL